MPGKLRRQQGTYLTAQTSPNRRCFPLPLLVPDGKNCFRCFLWWRGVLVEGVEHRCVPSPGHKTWERKTALCCGTLKMKLSGEQASFQENWLTLGRGFARFLGGNSWVG